jgi:hypothetical protein
MTRFGFLLALILLVSPEKAFSQDETVELTLLVNVDSAFVVIDNDYSHPFVISSGAGSMELPAGVRDVTVAAHGYADSNFRIRLGEDEPRLVRVVLTPLGRREFALTRSSYPRLAHGATLAIHADDDAAVYVDGKRIGQGTTRLDLPAGKYQLAVRHPNLPDRTRRVSVEDDRLTVADLYIRPSLTTSRQLAVLPGGTQFYRRENARAAVIVAAFASATGFAAYSHVDYRIQRDEFNSLREAYRIETREEQALLLGDRAESARAQAVSSMDRRNVALGVAAAIYAVHLVDAFRKPREGFRQERHYRYSLSPTVEQGKPGIYIGMRF